MKKTIIIAGLLTLIGALFLLFLAVRDVSLFAEYQRSFLNQTKALNHLPMKKGNILGQELISNKHGYLDTDWEVKSEKNVFRIAFISGWAGLGFAVPEFERIHSTLEFYLNFETKGQLPKIEVLNLSIGGISFESLEHLSRKSVEEYSADLVVYFIPMDIFLGDHTPVNWFNSQPKKAEPISIEAGNWESMLEHFKRMGRFLAEKEVHRLVFLTTALGDESLDQSDLVNNLSGIIETQGFKVFVMGQENFYKNMKLGSYDPVYLIPDKELSLEIGYFVKDRVKEFLKEVVRD